MIKRLKRYFWNPLKETLTWESTVKFWNPKNKLIAEFIDKQQHPATFHFKLPHPQHCFCQRNSKQRISLAFFSKIRIATRLQVFAR